MYYVNELAIIHLPARRVAIMLFILSATCLSLGPHCARTNVSADSSFCSNAICAAS